MRPSSLCRNEKENCLPFFKRLSSRIGNQSSPVWIEFLKSELVLFLKFLMEGRDYPLSPLSKITRSTHSMRASAGVNPHRSAMVRSRPGRTSFLINVTSAPSKFKC